MESNDKRKHLSIIQTRVINTHNRTNNLQVVKITRDDQLQPISIQVLHNILQLELNVDGASGASKMSQAAKDMPVDRSATIRSLAEELEDINRPRSPALPVSYGLPVKRREKIIPQPERRQPASMPSQRTIAEELSASASQSDSAVNDVSRPQKAAPLDLAADTGQVRPVEGTEEGRRLREQFQQTFRDRERGFAHPIITAKSPAKTSSAHRPQEAYAESRTVDKPGKQQQYKLRWNDVNKTLRSKYDKREQARASIVDCQSAPTLKESDSESDDDLRELARHARARAANKAGGGASGESSLSPASTLNAAELLARMGQARVRFASGREKVSNAEPVTASPLTAEENQADESDTNSLRAETNAPV